MIIITITPYLIKWIGVIVHLDSYEFYSSIDLISINENIFMLMWFLIFSRTCYYSKNKLEVLDRLS